MARRKVEIGNFSEWLLGKMGELKIDQTALRLRAGVSQSLISEILSKKKNPGLETVLAIAGALTPEGANERTAFAIRNEARLAAGFAPEIELVPEPILDELRGAAFAGEITPDAAADIADYIRMKREQERRRKEKPPKDRDDQDGDEEEPPQ